MNRKERRIAQAQDKKPKLHATSQQPSDVFARAMALHQMGNLSEAEALYKTLLRSNPANTDIIIKLGTLKLQQGYVQESIWLLEQVIALNPRHAETYINHGIGLYKLKRYNEALVSYDKAIAIAPDYADTYYNRGILLYEMQHYDEAVDSFNKAIAFKPDHLPYAEAYHNRGLAFDKLGRYDEALASYDKAIALNSDYAEAYYNRGFLLYERRHYSEALANFDKAIAIDPGHADANFGKGLIKLALGEYKEGLQLYEWRWKSRGTPEHVRIKTFPVPLCQINESWVGKTILLHVEQGFGDALQFCRYVPMMQAQGAKILLVVPSSLMGLMSTLKGSFQLLEQGQPLPKFDYHCPLMSLPLVFKTTLETIPSEPYLEAQPEYIEKWQPILKEKLSDAAYRIGLCWAGGQRLDRADCVRMDGRRSMHFDTLKPLLDTANTAFVSLQLGPPKEQCDDARVADISAQLESWSDTAAVISQLDLVIAVDTSVVHLAAAMGKKTFLLNRYDTCWRWLLDRDDSPWYPTLTQFRQKTPGDWDEVIARVKAEMKKI